ncbi:hypothetical protein HZS_1163 [Henneguya salminicola]|nr:hypothetical protein HZS_1163 [Henneguya salminicola]
MSTTRKILRFICCLPFFIFYYSIALLTTILPNIFFILKPIIPQKFIKISDDILYKISQFPPLLLLYNKERKVFVHTNDRIDRMGSAILISNHQSSGNQ